MKLITKIMTIKHNSIEPNKKLDKIFKTATKLLIGLLLLQMIYNFNR